MRYIFFTFIFFSVKKFFVSKKTFRLKTFHIKKIVRANNVYFVKNNICFSESPLKS